jgi:hypothetical protein
MRREYHRYQHRINYLSSLLDRAYLRGAEAGLVSSLGYRAWRSCLSARAMMLYIQHGEPAIRFLMWELGLANLDSEYFPAFLRRQAAWVITIADYCRMGLVRNRRLEISYVINPASVAIAGSDEEATLASSLAHTQGGSIENIERSLDRLRQDLNGHRGLSERTLRQLVVLKKQGASQEQLLTVLCYTEYGRRTWERYRRGTASDTAYEGRTDDLRQRGRDLCEESRINGRTIGDLGFGAPSASPTGGEPA